jgi:hypothetical protein
LVELILAVAMAERELRQVAPRERRLLARDRIERDLRIGDDLLAILARDPGMVLDPLGLKPCSGIRDAAGPILCCGSRSMPCAANVRWSIRASISSSANRWLTWIPHASRHSCKSAVLFHSRTFWPKPSGPTSRIDSMTWARLGASVLAHIPMHIEVGHHTASTNCFSTNCGERDALLLVQLARIENSTSGKLRVLRFSPASTSFQASAIV